MFSVPEPHPPHPLRPCHCLSLMISSVNIKESRHPWNTCLGHADPQVALRIYTHLRKIHEHTQRDKIDNIFQAETVKTEA